MVWKASGQKAKGEEPYHTYAPKNNREFSSFNPLAPGEHLKSETLIFAFVDEARKIVLSY